MAQRQGKTKPLHEEPETDGVVDAFMVAYQRLSNARQSGMAANPLMFHDIVNYFDRLSWFCDDLELFVDIVQAMDGVMLKKYQDSASEK